MLFSDTNYLEDVDEGDAVNTCRGSHSHKEPLSNFMKMAHKGNIRSPEDVESVAEDYPLLLDNTVSAGNPSTNGRPLGPFS